MPDTGRSEPAEEDIDQMMDRHDEAVDDLLGEHGDEGDGGGENGSHDSDEGGGGEHGGGPMEGPAPTG